MQQTTSLVSGRTPPKLAGPLYNQIQLLMRERILGKEWQSGQAMPTEIELAREYSVSVGTMRKALDVLEDAKFIVRKQGLGTFVRELGQPDGSLASGWLVDGKTSQERIGKIVGLAFGEANTKDCAELGVGARIGIHRVRIISTIARKGSVLDEYVIPETTGFATESAGRDQIQALQQSLASLYRQVTRYTEAFTVEPATSEHSQLLHVSAGTPLLRIDRTAIDAKGRAMFTCIRTAHLDGARYTVEVGGH